MQTECLVRCQHVEAERSGAMTDQRPETNGTGGPTDLVVGNGEDHHIEVCAVEPVTERAFDPCKRGDQSTTHATVADNGAAAERPRVGALFDHDHKLRIDADDGSMQLSWQQAWLEHRAAVCGRKGETQTAHLLTHQGSIE